MQLEIARNPDSGSSLPFLVLVPVGDGLVFSTKGTWPRTAPLYSPAPPRRLAGRPGPGRVGAAALLRTPGRRDRPRGRPGP